MPGSGIAGAALRVDRTSRVSGAGLDTVSPSCVARASKRSFTLYRPARAASWSGFFFRIACQICPAWTMSPASKRSAARLR